MIGLRVKLKSDRCPFTMYVRRNEKGLSISDFSLIGKPKRVFLEKGLSIREKSLVDKTGLPKKVWQYCSPKITEVIIARCAYTC